MRKAIMNETIEMTSIRPPYNYKEMIDFSLKTWYPKNHPLHLNSIHPAMGLAGETGEILNKRKKDLFKANYEWHENDELDELGDCWYYIRVLSYQCKMEMTSYPYRITDLDIIRTNLALNASKILLNIQTSKPFKKELQKCQMWLLSYLKQLEITLDELTVLNWEKLKPGSKRGDEWTSSWDTIHDEFLETHQADIKIS